MPFRIERVKLDKSAGLFRRALQYAFYDWTREMPTSRRVITYVGIVLQAYAVYAMLMWAFVLPKGLAIYLLALPKGPVGYVSAVLVYSIGLWLANCYFASHTLKQFSRVHIYCAPHVRQCP
jgi:hypothetical protein